MSEDPSRRALALLREVIASLPREALPAFLGELEQVRAEILLGHPEAAERVSPEQVLTPKEVALRIGRSVGWTYRNRSFLPAVRLPGGRWGVPQVELDRWIRKRKHLGPH